MRNQLQLLGVASLVAAPPLAALPPPPPDHATSEGAPVHVVALLPDLPPMASLGQVRAAYFGALSLLGSRSWTDARENVVALESSFARQATAGALQLLTDAEIDLARRLAASSVDCLPAIAALHLAAYDEYAGRDDTLLAGHALDVARLVVALYDGSTRDSRTKSVAAEALTALAGATMQDTSVSAAEVLLRDAVAFAPDDEDALLALGAIEERKGRWAEAADTFSRLVAGHPGDLEGKLRLAVNLRRLGRTPEATTLLTSCLAPGTPAWIRAVAYQELGGVSLDGQHWDDAISTLDRASSEFPGDPDVAVELAYACERARRPRRADEVLAGLVRQGTSGGSPPSARFVYSCWPRQALTASRAALLATADTDRHALSSALASSMGPPGR